MGSRDSGETKVNPNWVQDPPWSFNGPCHGPKIHPTWPFIYWLYFCILCNKNGIKGLWRHKGQPSLVLGPHLVLQWTLPWSYNTPDLALLDSETSAWLGLGRIEFKQGSQYKGPCQVYLQLSSHKNMLYLASC